MQLDIKTIPFMTAFLTAIVIDSKHLPHVLFSLNNSYYHSPGRHLCFLLFRTNDLMQRICSAHRGFQYNEVTCKDVLQRAGIYVCLAAANM